MVIKDMDPKDLKELADLYYGYHAALQELADERVALAKHEKAVATSKALVEQAEGKVVRLQRKLDSFNQDKNLCIEEDC